MQALDDDVDVDVDVDSMNDEKGNGFRRVMRRERRRLIDSINQSAIFEN
jgi:hypothetical protein